MATLIHFSDGLNVKVAGDVDETQAKLIGADPWVRLDLEGDDRKVYVRRDLVAYIEQAPEFGSAQFS